ncbi:MAG: hypothetical protein M9886_02885 [Candidatus Nanopelagicales bacterium]|nr:hypothetical protein [Candidatus Nanopelagicales bacterium]
MARIDPSVRTNAIAALQAVLNREGSIGWAALRDMSEMYGIPTKSLYRWSRKLMCGEDPAVDGRGSRSVRPELSEETLALVAHHSTLTGAHKAAVAGGYYTGSYRQFVRDVDRLPPALRAGLANGKDALVRLLPTMSYPLVGRNETWVLDHTQCDVRVVANRSSRMFRPYVSILKDKGTGVVVGIQVSEERTRSTDVIGLLAAAMLQQTGLGGPVPVGGRPESLLCDNGAENMAIQIITGLAILAVALLPTTPGHSWQNGSAENIIRLYQQQCEATLPGYVKGGKGVDGGLRYTANTYDEENPDLLLTLDGLQAAAVQWAIEYNNTPSGKDGRTPLQRWVDDPGPDVVVVSEDEVAFAMTTLGSKHAATKNGLYFRNREYQAAFTADYVGRGKVLTVRYLPGVTDWIEVYDGARRLGRAWRKEMLPNSEQSAIIRARQAMTGKVRAAERASVRVRQAQARGEDTDAPLSAEQRRNPHTAKARKGMYGGGAKSDRDAKLMTEHQNLASEMFGHILDRPMNDGGAE